MFLAFGLVMQFPFVILLLSKVGIVTVEQLRRNRRYVFVGIVIIRRGHHARRRPLQPDDHDARHVPALRADDPPRRAARTRSTRLTAAASLGAE